MARLPKFLNLSAAGRVRLALPAAKLALIAFSCTMAVVGMGAFVATLPALSADSSVIDAAGGDSAGGEKRGAAEAGEEPGGEAEEGEDADGEASDEARGADAGDGSGTAAGSSAGAASVGGPVAAAGGSGATSGSASNGSGASSGSGSSGASGSSGSAASSGASSGSGSNSGSGSSSSSDSGSSSGSTDAAAEEEVSSVPDDDPFCKIPTAAEEEAFHTFLVNWYAKFPQAEAESRNGDSTIAWDGYTATLDYVRSNYSQWCKAQENMIGAFRCLGEWNGDDAHHKDSYNQYLTWKNGIVL